MILGALIKVVYSIFKVKFGVNLKKKKEPKAKKGPKKQKYSEESDSSRESEFSLNNDVFLSDDSEFAEKTATMQQICESIDSV
jgi:hypothetical protein